MNFDKIPQELRELDRWVCWRWEERLKKDGSPDDPAKMPINPVTGGRAMSNNPATWGTFHDAVNAANAGHIDKTDVCGIGFMFNGDGVIGVDIDHCRDSETGQLTEQAKDIIATLDSYTEYSQSGKGVHIICYGKLPEGGRRKSSVEMYSTGRYFIVTGDTLDDAHTSIEERTDELLAVHDKYINVKKQGKNEQKVNKNVQNEPVFVNDDEIIDVALNAKNGSLFSSLMDGNWKGAYGSQSEADLALCNLLAFYAGRDAAVMDRLYRRSGLFRDKWTERRGEAGTYGEITIAKAIADCGEVYTPPRPRKEKQLQEPPEIDAGLDALANESPPQPSAQDITSDLGRSKRFSSKYTGQLYWCQEIKSWLIWNGKYWDDDRRLAVLQMAKAVIEEMVGEAIEAQRKAYTPEAQAAANKLFKETCKGRSEKAIKSMLELAKGDLPITSEELDADPFLLNCQNGIVDLRTGQLLPHDSSHNMSKIAGTNYEPIKKFQLFDKFLELITCGDKELADYLRDVCGMAAIGKVFYEGICMFHGNGQNGKTTFLNAVSRVFGNYAYSINPELLMVQKDGKQPLGIVQISGKRFVTAMETEEGRRLSGAMLKKLASTDPITGRDLYQKDRTFLPSHTLIMATNFLPKVSSTDVGTWRRILVVPFRASIRSDRQIKDYASQLFEQDGDAMLSWIVEGAMRYVSKRYQIKIPEAVSNTTKSYRDSEDWIGNFIYECCEIGNYEEQGGKLYDAYVEWCEKNNETYKRRPRDFASALEIAGYEKRKTMHGAVWQGLKLIIPRDQYSNRYHSVKGACKLDDDDLDEMARRGM